MDREKTNTTKIVEDVTLSIMYKVITFLQRYEKYEIPNYKMFIQELINCK